MSLIVKIGADTRKFEKEMKNLTKQVSDVTESMRGHGEAMATSLTAPIVAVGGIAAVVATQFDDAQGQMQASLGLTGKEAEKLGGVAEDLWKKGFGESIAEASEQVANVSKNMREIPTDELGKVAEEAMTVSKIFGQDINDVTKSANSLMKNFGMTSTEAFDYITKGFQGGMDYSNEFLDSLNEYAPQFKSLGFTGDEFFKTLASGAESGAFQLDKVGDAVKEFNIRAIDGSKASSEAYEMLGMDAAEMTKTFAAGGPEAQKAFQEVVKAINSIEDPVKKNAAGVGLFGTMFEDLEEDVMAAMGTTTDMFDDVEGSTKKAGDAVKESMGEQFKSTFRELQAALEPLGAVLLDIAEDWLPKIASAAEAVSGWFSDLSPNTQKFVVALAAIAAAVGPLLIVLAMFMNALAFIKGAFLAVGVASLGAIAIWIAVGIAVAALIAAIIIYWDEIVAVTKKVWGAIKDFMVGLWNSIVEIAKTVFGWYMTYLSTVWGFIFDVIKTVWTAIKTFLIGLWNGIVSAVTPIFSAIGTFLASIWNGIKTAVQAVWNFIKQYLVALWKALLYLVTPIFNSLKTFLQGIWNSIKSVITSVWNNIKSFLSKTWNGIKSVASTVWNGIKTVATSVWNAIKNAVEGPVNKAKDKVSSIFKTLKSTVSSIWNSIKSVALSVWGAISSSVSGKVSSLVSGVKGAFNGLKSAVLGVWNGIKSGMKSVINGIISMVNKFIGGFNSPAKLLNKIPGVDAPTIPKIPMLATGGTIFGNGQAIVGEAGPELVSKSGSSVKVTPLSSGEKARGIGGALAGGGGTVIVPVNLDGKTIATVTAPYMDNKLGSRKTSKSRARGDW